MMRPGKSLLGCLAPGAVALLVCLASVAAPPARAESGSPGTTPAAREVRAAPPPVLLAEGWSPWQYFRGAAGRTRVVQFCVVTMCVALFIMMRKLC
jgi:hypothetical protein